MSGAGWMWMAPARLFPTGVKLSYHLQLNFILNRVVLS